MRIQRIICNLLLCSTWIMHAYIPRYEDYPGFQTLSQAIAYKNYMPETPNGDFSFPLDPDYTNFYRSNSENIFTRALQYAYLYPKPIWSAYDCAAVLNEVNKRHRQQDIGKKPVGHLKAQPNTTHLEIWGPLHGSYHSLVRCLEHWRHNNYLDENLVLMSPHYYVVINGNAIDLSPYSMETLTLIGNLELKNPGQITYIRGQHERYNYWFNFGLQRQIKEYTKYLYHDVPYADIINQFFETLPYALYVTTTSDPQHALRISFDGINESEIDDQQLGDLFEHDTHYQKYDASKQEPTTQQIDTISLIRNEPWMFSQRSHDGLGLLEQEQGATTWAVLSCPTYPYRTYYPFTKDAYATIKIGTSIQNSTIHLYNRPFDAPDDTPFKEQEAYNIYTSVPVEQAQESQYANTFKIGSTMGLELNLRVMSEQTRLGAMTEINNTNQNGGIHNDTHIRMYTYNDDYQPYQAQHNIQYMIDHGIETILGPTGTPTLTGYLDKVRNNEILVLFPITGSPAFRKRDLEGVIHVRSTYAEEVEALITYMVEDYSASSFAFFYQDDAYGWSALYAARDELKKHGIKDWTEVPYVRGSASFEEQAETIRKAAPQAIGFFSASEPLIKLINAIGIPWLANKQMFAITFAFTQETRRFIQQTGLSMTVGAVTPNPHVSDLPIAQEYRADMDANNEAYDKFSFESYIGTRILTDAANKVEGPVTRNKIKNMIESYNNYNFKGLNLTFNPETRSIAPGVWIETTQDQPWEKKL